MIGRLYDQYFHRRIPMAAIFCAVALFTLPGSAPVAEARAELQPCKNGIAPEQQIELGRKAAQQVYQQMPVLPDSSQTTRYVQALGQKLTAQAPGYHWPYNFHVVNVADINAFALPGGTVFVNLGTVQAAGNEAQLAAVMAHELSHVVLQHSVCNLEKQQKVGLLAGIGQLAAGVLLGDSTVGNLAQQGIGLSAGLSFLKMSRGAEQEADIMGVGLLYDAGYDPHAMPQFFETIEQKYGKGGAQFLSDHPNPGNRSEYVAREIGTFVPKQNYVTNSPKFIQMHKQVAGLRAYTAKEVESGAWRSSSPNQAVSTGVNDGNGGGAGANIDMTPAKDWTTYQGTEFSLLVPSNWKVAGEKEAAMLAPSGGISQAADGRAGNLVLGLMTDVYRPDPASGNADFSALLEELRRENPGLQPGNIQRVEVGGRQAQSVETVNRSTGAGGGERDWIVGVPIGGAIRYFVFVAPEANFATMRPTFERISNSIRLD